MDRDKNKFIKKKPKTFVRGFVSGLVLASITVVFAIPFAIQPEVAKAQFVLTDDQPAKAQRAATLATEQSAIQTRDLLQSAADIAFKQAMRYFLNTLAYDTATWLASGGEGEQPLFYTDGWGSYLSDLADGAAGSFLETIGDDFLGINVSAIGLKTRLS